MRAACFLPLLALPLFASAAVGENCAALASASLPATTITKAEAITTGTLVTPYGDTLTGLPAFCRVTGVLRPSADSTIRFEVWLPQTGWNYKFLGSGNGGFAGNIYYGMMAGYLKRGYATAGTDTGHQAGAEDASWAYRHPEKIRDFGYRGLHLTTERAKSLIASFYGKPASKAYFESCSDGGREALMEAQRFPADYDGILAGAPANDWTHLLSSGLASSKAIDGDPAAYIPAMKLPAVTAAVLAACDAQDGLRDGILNDPRTCHFEPETLQCKGEDELTCLTAPQVASLKTLYSGGKDSAGRALFPGLMPGDEAGAWPSWVIGTGPGVSNYVQGFFRYMVMNDPTWNPLTADKDAAAAKAQQTMAEDLNATDPDLSRFAARGGKLILYHGWNDPAISPLNTIAYYGSMQAKLGAAKTAEFVRLYMVPGMEHCAQGPGPNAFGQLGIPTAAGPKYGIETALESWREDGTAPGAVIATKYVAGNKVEMMRPLCVYPQIARYDGKGDRNVAGSFACVQPGR